MKSPTHDSLGLVWDDRFVRTLPADPIEDNLPRQVHRACFSRVRPTPVSGPALVAHAPEVAKQIGLSEAAVARPLFTEAVAGNQILTGMEPYAACYGGHQFGHWAGQLGDGRAITLGEVVHDNARFELQLKGAGPTPYSRRADGRAVLRSSIREFLCSEAMHHLGVPTTRALSLVTTGDPVRRDMFYDGNVQAEPGAIVCRVAPSFLRFGSFQIHAARDDVETLRTLLDDTIVTHFPHLGPPSKDTYLAWLAELAERTAEMVVHWMRVGFVHGVMNTDNMSALGLTIDYGPYGWLEGYDPDWTPNTTDFQSRRYRYGTQTSVAGWNLARLAEALLPLDMSIPNLEGALGRYSEALNTRYRQMIADKLGFLSLREGDNELYRDLNAVLQATETDMTLFYRHLADLAPADREADDATLLAPLAPAYYDPAGMREEKGQIVAWLRRYLARADAEERPREMQTATMNKANPRFVLRNYLAQEAIDLAQAGDTRRVTELLDVMRRPYDEQPGRERFAARRPDWARNKPGCSTLSCSS
ncbi:MAG: YdiU family protein [Myxococcota bacterium]